MKINDILLVSAILLNELEANKKLLAFFFKGRSRWIIYADKYGLDYDGSQVDPEW